MFFIPEESEDAEITAERIAIRLQHANSAVVLTTIKVILHLMNYIQDENRIDSLCRKLSPPLGGRQISRLFLPAKVVPQSLSSPLAMKCNMSLSAISSSSYSADRQCCETT